MVELKPIGIIHSDYVRREGVPIQGSLSVESKGWIELFPEFKDGLQDLGGFSHIILIYHFHLSNYYSLRVRPFLDEKEHGVFATRAPKRPNPLGISIVRLRGVKKNILRIAKVDIIDGTPLLDIKPYVHAFDHRRNTKVGWIDGKLDKKDHHADDRFF